MKKHSNEGEPSLANKDNKWGRIYFLV